MNKKPQKQKGKSFYCFSCKTERPTSVLARKGTRKNGSVWALCRECSDAYKAERRMDEQSYRAATGQVRTDEQGWTEMGWNGVPSEKALRRRRG